MGKLSDLYHQKFPGSRMFADKRISMDRKKFMFATLAALTSLPTMAAEKVFVATNTYKEPFIVRAGKNRSERNMMKFAGVHVNDVIISRQDTGDEISVFLFKGLRGAATSLHIHLMQDEFFHIISGIFRFVCGDLQEELHPGDTIFLPRNIPHQWLQLSDSGSLLYAVTPAGTLEEMFVEFDKLVSPPSTDELTRIHQRHQTISQKLISRRLW